MSPDIGTFHKQITAVGSRVTCEPPPTGTDQDWLVLVADEHYNAFADHLLANGWELGGSRIPEDVNYLPHNQRFNSFTKGEDNVIVTCSDEFHKRFLAASAVCKSLNLMHKADRISLFQAVLYGCIHDPQFWPTNHTPHPFEPSFEQWVALQAQEEFSL